MRQENLEAVFATFDEGPRDTNERRSPWDRSSGKSYSDAERWLAHRLDALHNRVSALEVATAPKSAQAEHDERLRQMQFARMQPSPRLQDARDAEIAELKRQIVDLQRKATGAESGPYVASLSRCGGHGF